MSEHLRTWAAELWRAWVTALMAFREIIRGAWAVARAPVFFVLNILAALIVLFEEWGWRPLSELLARLAKYRLWAAIERGIATLPPYLALLAIALPTTLLLPLKFVAVWLLANGQYWTATALFIAAKIFSTALIARVFLLTKPALMQIGWFARAYDWFMPWKEHLFAIIRASWVWRYGRMLKTRVKLQAGRAVRRWRPVIDAQIGAFATRARAWTAHLKERFFGAGRA